MFDLPCLLYLPKHQLDPIGLEENKGEKNHQKLSRDVFFCGRGNGGKREVGWLKGEPGWTWRPALFWPQVLNRRLLCVCEFQQIGLRQDGYRHTHNSAECVEILLELLQTSSATLFILMSRQNGSFFKLYSGLRKCFQENRFYNKKYSLCHQTLHGVPLALGDLARLNLHWLPVAHETHTDSNWTKIVLVITIKIILIDFLQLTWKPFTPSGPGLPAGPIPPCWT